MLHGSSTCPFAFLHFPFLFLSADATVSCRCTFWHSAKKKRNQWAIICKANLILKAPLLKISSVNRWSSQCYFSTCSCILSIVPISCWLEVFQGNIFYFLLGAGYHYYFIYISSENSTENLYWTTYICWFLEHNCKLATPTSARPPPTQHTNT